MHIPNAASLRRGLFLLAIAATAWGTGGAAAEILYQTTGLTAIAVCWWRLTIAATILTCTRRLDLSSAPSGPTPAGCPAVPQHDSVASADIHSAAVAGFPGVPQDDSVPSAGIHSAAVVGCPAVPQDDSIPPVGIHSAAVADFPGVPQDDSIPPPAIRPAAATSFPAGRADWLGAVPIGIGLAVAQVAYFASIADVGVAIATMVTLGAGPLLVALGARFVLGERLTVLGAISVVVALGGLVLLTGGADAGGPRPVAGIGLALLAATAQALTTILGRRRGRAADTTAVCWIGAIGLAPFALVAGIVPSHGLPIPTIGWLVYLGVIPTALAYPMFFAGLATVPATIASVVTLLEPVTAAVIAVGLLGERLTTSALVGTAVLLLAVAGSSLATRRK